MYTVTSQSDNKQRTMTAIELKKMLRPNQLEHIEIAIECSGYYEDDQFRVEPCEACS